MGQNDSFSFSLLGTHRKSLKTTSFKPSSNDDVPLERFSPSWERGFTRKARSRRSVKSSVKAKHRKRKNDPVPIVVPEVGNYEILSFEENEEEQLFYMVPIYDPFDAELCTSTTTSNDVAVSGDVETIDAAATHEYKIYLVFDGQDVDGSHGLNFPCEMDLAEFAADVESLLGKGLANESFVIEELGLMNTKEDNFRECSLECGEVKVEDNDNDEESFEGGMAREPFELSFNYDSPVSCGVEDEIVAVKSQEDEDYEAKLKKRKTLLSLNYEYVISSWATQGSPWTSSGRPDIDTDQYWHDCTGNGGIEVEQSYGGLIGMVGQHQAMCYGGTEKNGERGCSRRK